jgi:hypothetical protein
VSRGHNLAERDRGVQQAPFSRLKVRRSHCCCIARISWLLPGRFGSLGAGRDWAEDHHDVEVVDEAGRVLVRRRLPEDWRE